MGKHNLVDGWVSSFFSHLGLWVGKHPGYFILVPVMLTGILITGLQNKNYLGDPEYLFTPTHGRSKDERAVLESLFPMNESVNFDLGRVATLKMFGRLLVQAVDGGSVLRNEVLEVLHSLDDVARNISVTWNQRELRYEDLCARKRGKCYDNDILNFKNGIPRFKNGSYQIKWPLMINKKTFKVNFYGAFLGGVELDEGGWVKSAKVAKIGYHLDIADPRLRDILPQWEEKFLEVFGSMKAPNVSIAYLVSKSLSEEVERNADSAVPYFSVTVVIMLTFSVLTCCMADWVRSKPILGILGFFSSMMAVGSTFGFMIYCRVDFIGINSVIPFLMIGIGMDDTFVLLASWRRTDRTADVPSRMSAAYRHAGVSITVTSLTNFISFWVGLMTPFPAMEIFCSYTAVAVLFTYLYHVTFFGACMAVAGRMEARGLHAVTFRPALPRSQAGKKNRLYQIFCTGGCSKEDPNNPLDNQEHFMMTFFRDRLGKALDPSHSKSMVLLGFVVYLVVGLFGVSQLKEGTQLQDLPRYDSYATEYFRTEYLHFKRYPFRIQILVNGTHDYADPKVQEGIESLLRRFESNRFVEGKHLTESWLRVFLWFAKNKRTRYFLDGYNISVKEDFNSVLRDVFFRFEPARHFENDVVFNANGTEIVATRYVVQSGLLEEVAQVKDMLRELRAIADSSAPFQVTIYNFYFVLMEQLLVITEVTVQAVVVAAVVMMCVIFLFIPSPLCAFWVAFSIVSIEVGVVGYMALWGVTLNITSMVCLIMCIGFSVDYSAHISYAYISCTKESVSERMHEALFFVGMPILQGSLSTLIGVVALAFAPSYMFLGFFKTVFLVILFASLHGLIILPVLLSFPYEKIKAKASHIKCMIFKCQSEKNAQAINKNETFENGKPNDSFLPSAFTKNKEKLPSNEQNNNHSCVNNGFLEETI